MADTPTVDELKLLVNAIAASIVQTYGLRTSVVLMVGVPIIGPAMEHTAHDRFAAVVVGPCLMSRGLLAWGTQEIERQIDAADTSMNGKCHP